MSSRSTLVRLGALAIGIMLFAVTLSYIDFTDTAVTLERIGVALPVALLFSGLWHLARTWAWSWCFPRPRAVSFARLARVRLAAEAFSYLTIRGVAGEPLKIVLLADSIDARQATAAVALERLAYMVGTLLIVGMASVAAMLWLPLGPVWFRVFRAFAIVAALAMTATAVIVAGRGTYLQAAMRRVDARLGTTVASGKVGRFVGAVERQVLDLIRGNPRRLAVLAAATTISFLMMVLEAWVVLRAVGEQLGVTGAFAIETFSRVASFASAFIPANLGALEASSLAAVAAAGAGGGAALAVVRRIRGLFWAGIGLAIYPRARRPKRADPKPGEHDAVDHKPTLLYLPYARDVEVLPSHRLAGLSIAERVVRSALKAGYGRVIVADTPRRPSARLRDGSHSNIWASIDEAVIVAASAEEWRDAVRAIPASQCVTVIGGGSVVSPGLLAHARTHVPRIGEVMDVAAGPQWPVSGVVRMTASFAADLRGLTALLARRRACAIRSHPSGTDVAEGRAYLVLAFRKLEELSDAEETIRRSSYKPTDAKIARFNRRMSLPLSVALIRTPLTANQFSVVLVLMGFYSAWLFSLGSYAAGVLGGFLSLAASVLDGCDGEIARLKYQESALGCWIETIGDYSYYIAIFVGLTIGAVRQTGSDVFYWLGGAALAGTLASFALLIYLRSRITGGQPGRLHTIARDRFKAEPTLWSRVIWRISFVATRAAMPYGIMAFAILYALPGIVVLAALGANIYWLSLVLKLKDLLEGDEERIAAA